MCPYIDPRSAHVPGQPAMETVSILRHRRGTLGDLARNVLQRMHLRGYGISIEHPEGSPARARLTVVAHVFRIVLGSLGLLRLPALRARLHFIAQDSRGPS
jgi:hypothetical protein